MEWFDSILNKYKESDIESGTILLSLVDELKPEMIKLVKGMAATGATKKECEKRLDQAKVIFGFVFNMCANEVLDEEY